MDVLAVCMIVVGLCASTWGVVRFVSSRREVLAPSEVPRSNGLPVMVAGDLMLAAGIILLVL